MVLIRFIFILLIGVQQLSIIYIYVLENDTDVATPMGGILEAYTINEQELLALGDGNAFKIEDANWLIEPWTSTRWPNAYAYEGINGNSYYNVLKNIWENMQIKLISPGKLYMGYKIGGNHYSNGEKIW